VKDKDMNRIVKIINVLLVGGCLGAVQCDTRENSPVEKDCLELCQAAGCDDSVVVDSCSKECVDQEDAAGAVSAECADLFRAMVACASEQGCPGASDWFASRGATIDYPCRAETEDFEKGCPGVWFAE